MLHEKGTDESELKESLKKFGKSMESQINLVERFCAKSIEEVVHSEGEQQTDQVDLNIAIQDYQKFRKELTDLEYMSDLLYCEVEKFMTKPEMTPGESS